MKDSLPEEASQGAREGRDGDGAQQSMGGRGGGQFQWPRGRPLQKGTGAPNLERDPSNHNRDPKG